MGVVLVIEECCWKPVWKGYISHLIILEGILTVLVAMQDRGWVWYLCIEHFNKTLGCGYRGMILA